MAPFPLPEQLSYLDGHHADCNSLQALLIHRAGSAVSRSLIFYSTGNVNTPVLISYRDLYNQALHNRALIESLPQFQAGFPILIHLDDQYDAILWFWTVLLAKCTPVMSSPFSNVEAHRINHIRNLWEKLQSPICIMRAKDMHLFNGDHGLHLHAIESLHSNHWRASDPETNGTGKESNSRAHLEQNFQSSGVYKGGDTLAALMLTSGSTGNSKAVCLTHKQILAAVKGKSAMRALPPGYPFLNWIGLDHVASLVEIHIPALWLNVDQVHVHASDIVPSPKTFLDILSRHRVCRSFAPNFFLAKLATITIESEVEWDLSALTLLVSGGEANDTSTCISVSKLLENCGAVNHVIVPGFGMTETCAGSIYNMNCPDLDLKNNYVITSVGRCIDGMEIRLSFPSESSQTTRLAQENEVGNLEVRGDVVFKGYYRQPDANREAFTSDGWFRTGDQGIIDSDGNLRLVGRAKDVININGIKFATSDVQSSLESAAGLLVTRIICFPSRADHTERVTVAYTPLEWPINDHDITNIEDLVTQACFASCKSFPLIFAVGNDSIPILPTSALGKISRSKMSALFDTGHFAADVKVHRERVKNIREELVRRREETRNDIFAYEEQLLREFSETLGNACSGDITADTNIFELGINSMDLIRLKHRLQCRLAIELPIALLIKHSSPKALASVLYGIHSTGIAYDFHSIGIAYDPVVTIQSQGAKTPLWLVHPGVGEVLVFMGLAQHLRNDDRPIYALRARGFEGQKPFTSIEEAVNIYVEALQTRQPQGPYALAGYSYGTMLAFEMAKKLQATGASVKFLGSFNLPPHIKMRMRHLTWNLCLLNLSYFIGIVSDVYAEGLERQGDFQSLGRSDALQVLLEAADADRLKELGLSEKALVEWTAVAYSLQRLAVDYEPQGMVDTMDVFYAVPLKMVARSRKEWLEEHLDKWKDFSLTKPLFHEVGGAHYTMLGPDHVLEFSDKLRAALRGRGL
ncbi:hypothetical protein F4802DRAFT_555394 [Xylaria palmicola]|nr:hypothetical protein F4802DRAFT_555394 [Xylaria palmicola]